ncbi:MAG: polysaccharide deacetylase family protein [Chloroflexota bacterium]|nr:polysaccharide deacetylase family protein [Chloroflexota bacterium]
MVEQTGTALAQIPTDTPEPTGTPTRRVTVTLTPTPTKIPDTPTPTPTPWALESFSTRLYPGAAPVQYINDTCAYLENKWGTDKADPGTVVVPIMFHSILEPGKQATKAEDITTDYFEYFMDYAKQLGFSTITTTELVEFLKGNQVIPRHSMILILDDRRPDTPGLFMPYLEANDWTLTLAWPTTADTSEALWAKMEAYVETGRVEVQSHGHNHAYIQSYTPQDVVEEEIYRPIEVIESHFSAAPKALIWPGGNFTQESVIMAADAGFELGFTVYSRGPIMYNWIPLGEPEQAVDNPLMVLPRAWSSAADVALIKALEISEAAAEQAAEVRGQEQLYFDLFCTPAEGD